MDFFHQVGNLRSPRTSHQTSIMSFRKSCLIGQPFVSKSVSSDDPNYHETCWIHTVESIWPKLRFCWILVSTSERGRCHILLIAKYHNSSPNYKVSIRIHLIQAYCLFNFYFWVKYALFEVPWSFRGCSLWISQQVLPKYFRRRVLCSLICSGLFAQSTKDAYGFTNRSSNLIEER